MSHEEYVTYAACQVFVHELTMMIANGGLLQTFFYLVI